MRFNTQLHISGNVFNNTNHYVLLGVCFDGMESAWTRIRTSESCCIIAVKYYQQSRMQRIRFKNDVKFSKVIIFFRQIFSPVSRIIYRKLWVRFRKHHVFSQSFGTEFPYATRGIHIYSSSGMISVELFSAIESQTDHLLIFKKIVGLLFLRMIYTYYSRRCITSVTRSLISRNCNTGPCQRSLLTSLLVMNNFWWYNCAGKPENLAIGWLQHWCLP